jgi:hypothetical protein
VGNTIENCQLGIQNVTYSASAGYTGNSYMEISGNLIRVSASVDPDNFPIFLSNCTVGSIHANTIHAPQLFQGIRIAHCSKVSVNGNTLSVGTQDSQGYAKGLVAYNCNNCAITANLIDLPEVGIPVGVWIADNDPYISANMVVQNNLILGPANPAIRLDTNPRANVAVVGNLSPSAVVHLFGDPALPRQPDVTAFPTGVLATQRIKMSPQLDLPALDPLTYDNWNPPLIHSHSYAVLRTSSPTGAVLKGIDAGYEGDYLYLVNYGPGAIAFMHDASSILENRFLLSGGTSQTIPAYGHISFRYAGNLGWVQIG